MVLWIGFLLRQISALVVQLGIRFVQFGWKVQNGMVSVNDRLSTRYRGAKWGYQGD